MTVVEVRRPPSQRIKGLPLGYAERTQFGGETRFARTPHLLLTVIAAIGDLVLAFGASGVAALILDEYGVNALTILTWSLLLLIGVRGMRGSECLVHEASHFNWSRNHATNDLLANALSGLVMFSDVATYRRSHERHHRAFGNAEEDPDLQRYLELGLEALDRSSAVSLVKSAIRRLPRYVWGWYRSIGAEAPVVVRALGVHAVLMSLTVLVTSWQVAALLWLSWSAGFLCVLPILRLIGEASEHVYTGSTTVFEATISNVGRLHRLLVHPHNDGYHVTHHLWPQIPHHMLRRFHSYVGQVDPSFLTKQRIRTRVLGRKR